MAVWWPLETPAWESQARPAAIVLSGAHVGTPWNAFRSRPHLNYLSSCVRVCVSCCRDPCPLIAVRCSPLSARFFRAHGQIVFFVWVTLGERKWSILAERRSANAAKPNFWIQRYPTLSAPE